MHHDGGKQQLDTDIERYFLGTLSATDQERWEEAYFTDDALLAQMLETEERLIESYANSTMPKTQRALFEQHYLTTDAKRARVATVRDLLHKLPQTLPKTVSPVSVDPVSAQPWPVVTPTPSPAWRERWAAWWSRPSVTPWAYALLLLTVGGCLAWGLSTQRRLNATREQLGQVSAQQAQIAQQQSELAQQRELIAAQERRLAELAPPLPAVRPGVTPRATPAPPVPLATTSVPPVTVTVPPPDTGEDIAAGVGQNLKTQRVTVTAPETVTVLLQLPAGTSPAAYRVTDAQGWAVRVAVRGRAFAVTLSTAQLVGGQTVQLLLQDAASGRTLGLYAVNAPWLATKRR